MRAALRKAVDEARAAGRIDSVELELRVLLADRFAAAVDRAAKGDDLGALVRAGSKLAELVGDLPLRESSGVPVGGGEPGGGDGGRGDFLSIVDGEAEVGDAADA